MGFIVPLTQYVLGSEAAVGFIVPFNVIMSLSGVIKFYDCENKPTCSFCGSC